MRNDDDSWDDAVHFVGRLDALRREHGRDKESFGISLGILEPPSVDLFKRVDDMCATTLLCSPNDMVAGWHDGFKLDAGRCALRSRSSPIPP